MYGKYDTVPLLLSAFTDNVSAMGRGGEAGGDW